MKGLTSSYTSSFPESQIKSSELLGGDAAVGRERKGTQNRTKFQCGNENLGQSSVSFTCNDCRSVGQSLGSPAFPIF